ncbi:extracellular solute-binding protein [Methylobacterium nigriterrae]|uniref:extracellular solute-binding protein n=1 Tax=Methylobacterium nigriterrae TaxID=3127512 RepID=UPI0030137FF0
MVIRLVFLACWSLVYVLAATPTTSADRPRLTIYTASQREQVSAMTAAVARVAPEADIDWVRASTGIVTDRVLAERGSPKADLIVGLAASSMVVLKKADLLAEYKPARIEELRSSFLDPAPPYSFTGMDVYFPVICMNTAQASAERVSAPLRWQDLTASRFKGRIVMAHPGSSGTGYGLVAGWLQSMGEERGWDFMDALHENVASYQHTGSAPCLKVAQGHHLLGLGLDMRAAVERAKGAPIASFVPVDKVGWDLEAFAILKSSPHQAIARRIADWAATREANEIYAQSYSVVARSDVSPPEAMALPHAEARMARSDLVWMAENRERIVAEWTRRYEAKSAPRQ